MLGKLNIIDLEEFLLSHGELSQHTSGVNNADNLLCYMADLRKGKLGRWAGNFVVYQRGILAGESRDGELLFKNAARYYGESSLAMFRVPKNREADPDLKEARGHFE